MADKQPRKQGIIPMRGSAAANHVHSATRKAIPLTGFQASEQFRIPTPHDAQYLRGQGDLRGLTDLLRYYNPDSPTEAAQVRRAAALALPDLCDPRIISLLSGALYDNSSIVRAAAAEGLGRLSTSIPVTGGAVSATGLTMSDRTRILSALFPLLHKERVDDVLASAAEAVYQTGGRSVLRPLIALARQGSVPFQRWFVYWASRSLLNEILIDLYPWAKPEIRDLIVDRLKSRLLATIQARLIRARDSGDKDLEELVQRVLG